MKDFSNLNKYRFFHWAIMLYMVAAFAWWAILLNKKNTENYHLKNRLIHVDKSFSVTEIEQEYQIQKRMIIGEGLVFGISIILGLVLINRGFWSELGSNRKLNNFLLSVTHELKTPLASLKMIYNTLGNKTIADNKKVALLSIAQQETSRLERLVDNILMTAQMEQSYQYNFEKINISEFFTKRLKHFTSVHPNNNFDIDIKENIYQSVDKEALNILFDNILNNAIKYATRNPTIKIELKENGKEIILSIADHGPGINKEEKEKIFEKFYRIGNEETRETKGTGLGLFIAKEIMNAHKGSIKITDNQPSGAVFDLIFPKR